mmetsp:Transcript_733/g.1208  ORF Transcript_733/g.1208 Transcript_733/m.1208 type:complete len:203 (-) Transcript_733:158-766(-)
MGHFLLTQAKLSIYKSCRQCSPERVELVLELGLHFMTGRLCKDIGQIADHCQVLTSNIVMNADAKGNASKTGLLTDFSGSRVEGYVSIPMSKDRAHAFASTHSVGLLHRQAKQVLLSKRGPAVLYVEQFGEVNSRYVGPRSISVPSENQSTNQSATLNCCSLSLSTTSCLPVAVGNVIVCIAILAAKQTNSSAIQRGRNIEG